MEETNLALTSSKLKQLQSIANGETGGLDSGNVKTKIALFLLAHADKVMDTVAPLEALRDVLSESYITKVQEKLEDPELTAGQLARMISDIQTMNMYSISSLRNILDADKLQAVIAVDASTNVENSTVNVLNLPNAASRSRVARALKQIAELNLNDSEGTDVIE